MSYQEKGFEVGICLIRFLIVSVIAFLVYKMFNAPGLTMSILWIVGLFATQSIYIRKL